MHAGSLVCLSVFISSSLCLGNSGTHSGLGLSILINLIPYWNSCRQAWHGKFLTETLFSSDFPFYQGERTLKITITETWLENTCSKNYCTPCQTYCKDSVQSQRSKDSKEWAVLEDTNIQVMECVAGRSSRDSGLSSLSVGRKFCPEPNTMAGVHMPHCKKDEIIAVREYTEAQQRTQTSAIVMNNEIVSLPVQVYQKDLISHSPYQ